MNRKLPIRGIILILLLLSVSAFSQNVYTIGDTVDNFTLNNLEGEPNSLYDWNSTTYLLNFFATW